MSTAVGIYNVVVSLCIHYSPEIAYRVGVGRILTLLGRGMVEVQRYRRLSDPRLVLS